MMLNNSKFSKLLLLAILLTFFSVSSILNFQKQSTARELTKLEAKKIKDGSNDLDIYVHSISNLLTTNIPTFSIFDYHYILLKSDRTLAYQDNERGPPALAL